jgi:peroxin-1
MSKFIGESEKAIREIFKRARAAAPCCLFFDEFDSICPRRGSDNAGVMDRLVNQLLTEIDGFEELRGVYVIATSSRPDTIDPALLRPGRLDNLLFLDWPTEKERYDIMWKLTRNIKTDPDVNLCAIAAKEMPHGTSGADIKGLLNTCSENAATRVIQAYEEALKRDPTLPIPTEVPSITAEKWVLAHARRRSKTVGRRLRKFQSSEK